MLTNENYFSLENQMKYMGVSQIKAFNCCPARAVAETTGSFVRESTTALLVGSYVDAYFEGTLDVFCAKHPELFKRDGSLKADYERAGKIIDRIEQQPLMTRLLSGEKQKIMTGEIDGVPVKIKIDSYLPDMIVDLKIMRDFEPVYKPEQGRLPWWEAWGYDIQGAVYQEIVRQNTGKKLPFVLVAATKEPVADVDAFYVPQELMDFELEQVTKNIKYYHSLKTGVFEPERCEKCDYCKQTKVLTEIKEWETADE